MSAPIGDREYAYSRCEACDTDNEPFHVNGAVATEQQNWATFVCDDCSRNWSVTTAAGIAHNTAMGRQTIGRVPPDVHSARFISAPSEAYRRGWELIFGKKGSGDGQDESHDR